MQEPLTFEADSHTYRVGGTRLPSVTEILAPIVDYSMVPPDVLAAAAEFGRNVHLATHLYDLGELDFEQLDPALDPYVRAWARFMEESGAVVIASEQPVVHAKLGYAGTPDRVLAWRDRLVVPDLKSTSVVPRSVGPQTVAYARAYQAMRGGRVPARYCIHLRADGTYRAHARRDPADWSMFLSCLNVYRFNHPHGEKEQ